MSRNLITYSLTLIMTILTALSCTDESELTSDNGNGLFSLASDKGIFTRAASEQKFAEGTAYQLYAIQGSSFEQNYLTAPASNQPVTGYESADHNSIKGIAANSFNGKTLNFYAVTNSTSQPITIIPGSNEAPTCLIEYPQNAPLTDVMWAKKENQTYLNSGTIKLLFGHTLAKLNMYVMKHSEYGNIKVELKSIALTDYPSGSLNMGNGKFNSSDKDSRSMSCTVYNGSQTVNNVASAVTTNNKAVTPMVFPTRKSNLVSSDRANHSMKIKVNIQIAGETTTQETEILSTMAEGVNTPVEVPFKFESNREYDMVITITKSSLIVTIVPRAYDWIPSEEIKTDDQMGSSMTIGGITWMDRNLGATSGNPLANDQEWEYSRGYYYQFGRNIPYFVKMVKDSKGIVSAPSNGNWHEEESQPYPFIVDKENEKPIAIKRLQNLVYFSQIAQNPTDAKSLKFNYYYTNDSYEDWDIGHRTSGSNWNSTQKQPCPKGWRLPTVDEFKLIIPSTESAGDITFSLGQHPRLDMYTQEEINDPEPGSSSTYVGVRKDLGILTVGRGNSIYALKRKGTNNAYFLRWHIEKAGILPMDNKQTDPLQAGDKYRNVLVISRYPATGSSSLSTQNVDKVANWDKPVEQVKLPISGYIHVGNGSESINRPALIYSGTEAVYWTSSTTGDNSCTVRMKFAGDSNSSQIMIYNSEIRSNGCLIRCVRDTKTN